MSGVLGGSAGGQAESIVLASIHRRPPGLWSPPLVRIRSLPRRPLTLLAIFTLLSGLVPPSASQNVDAEFDLDVTLFLVPNRVILDRPNELMGQITNHGTSPLRADVSILVSNATILNNLLFEATSSIIVGGGTTWVNATWNGRMGSSPLGDPVRGSFTLSYLVESADGLDDSRPENNVRAATRTLSIYQLGFTAGTPPSGVTIPSGSRWDGTVTIENQGNADDTVALEVLTGTTGWTFWPELATISLPVTNPRRTVIVHMDAPADAVAGSVGHATIQAVSEPASHVTSTVDLRSPPVRATGSVEVLLDPDTINATAGNQATFRVHVDNHRNEPNSFQLELAPEGSPAPFSPTINPQSPISVPAFGRGTFSVAFTIPSGAPAGEWTWRARVFAPTMPDLESSAPQPLRLSVRQIHSVQITSSDPIPDEVEPGMETEFRFNITNNGNALDTLRLVAGRFPPAWTLIGPASVNLNRGASLVGVWKVQVPTNATAQIESPVFRLESAIDPSAFDDLTLSLRVLERPHSRLETPLPVLPVRAGTTVEFPIRVGNVGNTADAFQLSIEVDASKTRPSPAAWKTNVSKQTFSLNSMEFDSALLRVAVPSGIGSTDGLFLNLSLQPANSADRGAQIQLAATPAMPDLVVIADGTDPTPAYRDHATKLGLRVENRGSHGTSQPTNLSLALRLPGQSAPFSTAIISIPPLDWKPGNQTYLFTVPIPTNQSSLLVTAKVDANLEVEERDESNNGLELTIPFLPFDLRVVVPPAVEAEPGQSLSFEGAKALRIENAGSAAAPAEVIVFSTPNWTYSRHSLPSLAPGQPHRIPINIVLPAEPLTEEARITVRVIHPSIPTLWREDSLRIRVADSAPPRILDSKVNVAVATMNSPVTFSATIRDAVGVHQAKTILVMPSGSIEVLPMRNDPGTQFLYTASYPIPVSGSMRWSVWAQDASVARNVNETPPQVLLVQSANRPGLQLIAPRDGAPIRPGTSIVLAVNGPAALARAEYAVAGTTTPVVPSNPLQIPTVGWTEGSTGLRVTVMDIRGSQAVQEYTFYVDSTPPRVSNLRVTPTSARTGDPVDVEVVSHDASRVVRATVRLQTSGGAGEDVELKEVRNGTFTERFALPVDAETLIVILEDEAGNVGYGERAFLSLLAEPESPSSRKVPVDWTLSLLGILVATLVIRGGTRWKRGGR